MMKPFNFPVFADHSRLDPSTPDGRARISGAINHFLAHPGRVVMDEPGIVHEVATASDFPAVQYKLRKEFQLNAEEVQPIVEMVFDVIDYTKGQEEGFALDDLDSALTIAEVLPGKKAKVFKVKGSSTYFLFKMYGAAIGYMKTLIDDGKWVRLERILNRFRRRARRDRLTRGLALVTAIAAGRNQAYDATGANQLEKDVNTINAGAEKLITDLADTGIECDADSDFVLVSPVNSGLFARMKRAVRSNRASSEQLVEFNVTVAGTKRLTGSDAYLILPAEKLVLGQRMLLTFLEELDNLAYQETQIAWERERFVLGEQKQLVRLKTV